MNLIHDDIKIRYVREGYLPNWPYHLISEEEMLNAFLSVDKESGELSGFFPDYYPLIDKSMKDQYTALVEQLLYHIQQKIRHEDYEIPDWVYSYMLGNVIGPESDVQDIHDLLVMLRTDNLYDVFDALSASACYDVSKEWVGKLEREVAEHRPPTIFGELHVVKSLRLRLASEISSYSYEGATN